MVLERAAAHNNVSSSCLKSGGLLQIIITFGVLLTDLSTKFDYLSHELLFPKLYAYGFGMPALRLVYSYLKQKAKN